MESRAPGEDEGSPRSRVWEARQVPGPVFLKVWPAGHLHQIHLGGLVPMQILGPAPNDAGSERGALESAFGLPR